MSKGKRERDGDEGEEMVLVPRVRLEFAVIKIDEADEEDGVDLGDWGDHCLARSILMAVSEKINSKPKVSDRDIHLHRMLPAFLIGPGPRWKVAKGTMIFRNFKFIFLPSPLEEEDNDDYNDDIDEELLNKTRQYLLEKFSPLLVSSHTGNYEIWGSIPPSEDADLMMSLVPPSRAFSGSRHEPSTIIISGVPSQWFVEQPSKPSKQLLYNFFNTFGKVRDVDTGEKNENETCCNIFVQYDNYDECYKALKRLCSFSLQKKGNSRMTADYEVAWKDIEFSCSQDKRSCDSSIGWPSKQVCCDPPTSKMVYHDPRDVGGNFNEMYLMLKHEKFMLKKKLKAVKAKLKTIKPSRCLYI